jgi:hypothetical protein
MASFSTDVFLFRKFIFFHAEENEPKEGAGTV